MTDVSQLSTLGVAARRERSQAWVGPGWVTRRQAQELLGLSRAQVDNLRREGRLDSERNAATGAVRIRASSVEAEQRRRAAPAAGDQEDGHEEGATT